MAVGPMAPASPRVLTDSLSGEFSKTFIKKASESNVSHDMNRGSTGFLKWCVIDSAMDYLHTNLTLH